MDGSNLLAGGAEVLSEIKENLIDLHECKDKYDNLVSEEDRLTKSVKSLEKDVAEEILRTTRKRRQEIEDTFEEQISKISSKIKRTKEKRDKSKDVKVSERIDEETAYLKEENKKLRLEAKAIYIQKHVPAICKTKLYYSLYFPKRLTDFAIILCTLLITLFIIPCGIYFYILPEEKILYLIIIYIVTVVIFFGLYVRYGNHTRDKHLQEIKQLRDIREIIRINNKNISVIKKNIIKDRDESTYGLEHFDEKLSELEKESAAIVDQEKESLGIFDNTTSQLIAKDIKGRSEEKLKSLRQDYERVGADIVKTEETIKALTLKIANEYEPFIGKDYMTPERLDSLINIIKSGSAQTISEAIIFYKNGIDESGTA